MISNYCINRTFFGQYFWCYVIRCSTQGSLPFSIVINFGSQSKITQFDLKYWEREINKKLFRENYVTKNKLYKIKYLTCNWSTYLHVIIQEDISKLEISVNYLIIMKIFNAKKNLFHEISSFGLRDGFPSFM